MSVATHAKIVIGAPDGDALFLVGHVGTGKFLGQAIDVVEVAVGLVLVLLVQFSSVVGIVVELGIRVERVDSRRSLARSRRSLRWSRVSISVQFGLAGGLKYTKT